MRSPSQEAVRRILLDEFTYYLDHQDEMVAQYDGKVIALKGHEVIGVYENEREAVREAQKDHPLGTFLVQKVSTGETDYTITVYSPSVTFMAHSQADIAPRGHAHSCARHTPSSAGARFRSLVYWK